MPIDEITPQYSQSTGHSYDEGTVSGTSLADFDIKILAETFPRIDADTDLSLQTTILLDNKVVARIGNDVLPTVAGFLMFAKDPQSVREFSNAYIEFQQFRKNTRADPIKKVEIKGNVPSQLDTAIHLLMQHIWTMPILENGRRIELPSYDIDAVREILTNALVHRDYTKMYFTVKIAMFDDRVEIENVGGLMPGLTTMNFIHKRAWRNPLLASLTKKVGFGEMDGQGIDRVYELSRSIRVPAPIFRDDQGTFVATLMGPKKFEDWHPEDKKRSLIALLLMERTIDNEKVRTSFGISAAQATTFIKTMLAENVVVAVNKSRKFAQYRFSDEYNSLVNS